MHYLETVYLGNSLLSWVVATAVTILVYTALRLSWSSVGTRLKKMAKRSVNKIDDMFAKMFVKTRWFFFWSISLYCGLQKITLSSKMDSFLTKLITVAIFCQIFIWGNLFIKFMANKYGRKDGGEVNETTVAAITFLSKAAFFSLVVLLALDNLGFDITALVAGLGIGGIAIALAVQSILGDLFSSLTIMFDRPFEIGDFIVIDDFVGNVEHIGLKTTRLRSLGGEQLVFSNSDLLSSRIRNYKLMKERRIIFAVGVTYQTPSEKLEKIPPMIKSVIESNNNTRFDRAHFKNFGDSALNFEIVYYMLVPDYASFMDCQQAINLELFKKFEQEGIEFAYPTQTLFVEKVPEALVGKAAA